MEETKKWKKLLSLPETGSISIRRNSMLSQENKLKILITTDLYTVTTNGVVTSVQNLFDELTASGHDVRILTISGDFHSHKEGSVYYIRSVPLKGVYPDLRMPPPSATS